MHKLIQHYLYFRPTNWEWRSCRNLRRVMLEWRRRKCNCHNIVNHLTVILSTSDHFHLLTVDDWFIWQCFLAISGKLRTSTQEISSLIHRNLRRYHSLLAENIMLQNIRVCPQGFTICCWIAISNVQGTLAAVKRGWGIDKEVRFYKNYGSSHITCKSNAFIFNFAIHTC